MSEWMLEIVQQLHRRNAVETNAYTEIMNEYSKLLNQVTQMTKKENEQDETVNLKMELQAQLSELYQFRIHYNQLIHEKECLEKERDVLRMEKNVLLAQVQFLTRDLQVKETSLIDATNANGRLQEETANLKHQMLLLENRKKQDKLCGENISVYRSNSGVFPSNETPQTSPSAKKKHLLGSIHHGEIVDMKVFNAISPLLSSPPQSQALSTSTQASPLLYTVSEEGEFVITTLTNNSEKSKFQLPFSPCTTFDISPDQKFALLGFAGGGADAEPSLQIFDISPHQKLSASLYGHHSRIVGVSIRQKANSHQIISCAMDRSVRIWDLQSLTCIKNIHCNSNIYAFAASPNLYLMATGHQNGSIKFWNMRDDDFSQHISVETGHDSSITGMSFASDNSQLVSLCRNHQIMIWDVRNLRHPILSQNTSQNQKFQIADYYARPVFSCENSRIAIPSKNGWVCWNLKDQSFEEYPCESHVTSLLWLENDTILTSHSNGVVYTWA